LIQNGLADRHPELASGSCAAATWVRAAGAGGASLGETRPRIAALISLE